MNIIRKYGRLIKRKYYILKNRLTHVHPTIYFGGPSQISKDLVAGAYSYIGPNCVINSRVVIGNYTMLANNISIIGGDHRFDLPGVPCIFSGRAELKPTKIGDDVWIGAHSIILCGVTIGDGAIIATGSVVTKDVEPFSVYGGVPAKKIKNRFITTADLNKHQKMLAIDPLKLDKSIIRFCDSK